MPELNAQWMKIQTYINIMFVVFMIITLFGSIVDGIRIKDLEEWNVLLAESVRTLQAVEMERLGIE